MACYYQPNMVYPISYWTGYRSCDMHVSEWRLDRPSCPVRPQLQPRPNHLTSHVDVEG